MMVMSGVGVGAGLGSIWFCASAEDMVPIANAKATAMAASTLRRAPLPLACEGRDAPRMTSNPTGRPALTTPDSLPFRQRFAPTWPEASIAGKPLRSPITGVVVGRPQVGRPGAAVSHGPPCACQCADFV